MLPGDNCKHQEASAEFLREADTISMSYIQHRNMAYIYGIYIINMLKIYHG